MTKKKNRESKRSHLAVPYVAAAIRSDKPWRSLGLSVPMSQANEFNQMYQEKGITGAYHERDGTFVAESRKARNEVLKLRNLRDNDAGYGDWAGK